MARNLETIVPALVLGLALTACGAAQKHRQIQQVGEGLRFELAALYVDKGAHQAAVPLLKKILSEKPDDVGARTLYGTVLRDMGLHLQAERELEYALDLEPAYAPAHAALGILFDITGQPERARPHHIQAVKLAPGQAEYLNNLGFSMYLAGETDRAIAALERSLALDPGLAIAYNNLGFAYGRAGQLERAEATFRRALDEPSVLVNMALVLDERGEDAEAAALRARAYTLNPTLAPANEEFDL
jgi:protein O-GlcNAc transferase